MAAIETPCTKVCTVDPVCGLCIGCGRTLAEIGGWTLLTAQERSDIMATLPARLVVLRERTVARVGA